MESKARPARPIQPGRLAAHRAEVVRVAVSALAATLLSGTAHAAALAGQEPPPPPPARVDVVGVVGDLATGGPVVGAFVHKDGAVVGITDDQGVFRMLLLPGHHRLEVRRLGYRTKSIGFELGAMELAQLTIPLDPEPLQLPEISVEVDRTRLIFGPKREFYRRAREGTGSYITRTEIERLAPRAVSDLLRRVPGLEILQEGVNPARVRTLARRGSCQEPLYFVDGLLADIYSPDLLATPDQIEGLEIYTRPLGIPEEFNKQGSVCGVIAIWTR
ncbi:MAG: hypothetical protein O2888_00035 [Chloroflexi bacterium]|nr:hypothetical protein [Chloroflexota bacterium]